MRTRSFGRMRWEVSEITLGTWGLSGDAYGPVHADEVERVLDRAVEAGVTLFDTADVYGQGAMERVLGERLDPATTRVITKIGTFREEPPVKRFDRQSLQDSFDRSQERLKRDTLDVVLLHNPSCLAIASGEAVALLQEQVAAGKLAAWGVSAGSMDVASAAIDAGADVVMVAYNLFVAREVHFLTNLFFATETALLARSTLAHGLMAGTWEPTHSFAVGDHRAGRWDSEGLRYRLAQLDGLRFLVDGEVSSLRAAALRFVLSNNLVTSLVAGTRSLAQLDELLAEVGEGPPYLSEEVLMELPAKLREVGIVL